MKKRRTGQKAPCGADTSGCGYRVFFVSLGCAKNLVNSEQMMFRVQSAGHLLVGEGEDADVAVLNTCGFIDAAKAEAIDAILSLAKRKEEGTLRKILVAGCLSERYRGEILKEFPEADGLIGTGSFPDVVSAIEAVMAGARPQLFGDIDRTEEEGGRILPAHAYTAHLKIAEGCDNRCAYCVIPSLRGKYRSRPMELVLEEARGLADRGVQELLVIAQDITRYGTDLYGKRRLAELLRKLCEIEGLRWIRLHYLYPDEIDGDLIDAIAEEPKILKYLDIPIQHSNDQILMRMNRRSVRAQLEALLGTLRARIPDVVLRTSIICGLPGEKDAEFEELCDFLRRMKIERAGVFTYSAEEGTSAANMPDQVPEETARRRAELVTELQSRVMDAYCERQIGKTLEVLCEGFDEERGMWVGRTYADSPEIDGHIFFHSEQARLPGTFLAVIVDSAEEGDLFGTAIS